MRAELRGEVLVQRNRVIKRLSMKKPISLFLKNSPEDYN